MKTNKKRKRHSISNDNKYINGKDLDEPEQINRKNLRVNNNIKDDNQFSKMEDISKVDNKRISHKKSNDSSKNSREKKNGSDLIKFRKNLPIWQGNCCKLNLIDFLYLILIMFIKKNGITWFKQ